MRLNKNIAISESGFVFNPARGDSFSVNPIGTEILQHLKEEKEELEILDLLLQRYEIDPDTLEKDLYDFIKVLKQFNLLEA